MGSSISSMSPVPPFEELNNDDEILRNVTKYILIWIDTDIHLIENDDKQIKLKNLIEDLFMFDNFSNAQQKIKEIKSDKIFIVLNGDDDNSYEFILNIHPRTSIAAIYVYSQNIQSTRFLLRPIAKVKYVDKNLNMIMKKLKKDINIYENLEHIPFIPYIYFSTDQSLKHQFYFMENLLNISDKELNSESKLILFETYENFYGKNNIKIKEFKEKFDISTSIHWFIEEDLISRLFNNICSNGYWDHLWNFQYLIECLYLKLKQEHILYIENLNKKSIINVYFGQLMNILEFKRLKMLIGENIFLTNFLLANFDKDKIIHHINQCIPSSNEICFIYKIILHTNLQQSQPYAPIYFNNQNYLLFMFGTNFQILDVILNPHDQIPIVLLQLSDRYI